MEIVDCGQLKSKEEEAAEKEQEWLVRDGSHMIPDKVSPVEEAVAAAVGEDEGKWEVLKPVPKPTAADLAVQSAEIDDD